MKSGPKKRAKKQPAGRSRAKDAPAPYRKPGVKRRPLKAPLLATAGIIEVEWPGVRTAPDGKEKRFYRMDTLINGVQSLLENKQCWILLAIQSYLGPADVNKLTFHVDREDRHGLYFRLEAANVAGKRGKFTFMAARNHQEHTRGLERRIECIDRASRCAPKQSLQLFGMGPIFLPDRQGRPSQSRALAAAVTSWSGGKTAAWRRGGQIVLNGDRPEVLKRADTDDIRAQVTELVLRCYDPIQRDGIAPPHLDTGDLLITRVPRAGVRVHYAGGNVLSRRPNPVRLLARLFEDRDGGIWLPEDPEGFLQAATAALGEESAKNWLRDYVKQADCGSVTSPGKAYVDALRELVVE